MLQAKFSSYILIKILSHVEQEFARKKTTMIEWKEREHEAEEMEALHGPPTLNALRNCGLFKFFKTHSMRRWALLLNSLVGILNVDLQAFCVGSHVLEIDLEDV